MDIVQLSEPQKKLEEAHATLVQSLQDAITALDALRASYVSLLEAYQQSPTPPTAA